MCGINSRGTIHKIRTEHKETLWTFGYITIKPNTRIKLVAINICKFANLRIVSEFGKRVEVFGQAERLDFVSVDGSSPRSDNIVAVLNASAKVVDCRSGISGNNNRLWFRAVVFANFIGTIDDFRIVVVGCRI